MCGVGAEGNQFSSGSSTSSAGAAGGQFRLRERNQRAFGREDFDYLVVNSAGCGSHLKDFYPNLGPRVRDLFEILAEAGLLPATQEVPVRVTYQDACHLVHAPAHPKAAAPAPGGHPRRRAGGDGAA